MGASIDVVALAVGAAPVSGGAGAAAGAVAIIDIMCAGGPGLAAVGAPIVPALAPCDQVYGKHKCRYKCDQSWTHSAGSTWAWLFIPRPISTLYSPMSPVCSWRAEMAPTGCGGVSRTKCWVVGMTDCLAALRPCG